MGKKQHYVPQTLLRNWSSDGQSIHVYQLDLDKFIETAPIDSQAQKHYYYGEDQKIENLLSTLEGEPSTIIRKILQGDREFTIVISDSDGNQKMLPPDALLTAEEYKIEKQRQENEYNKLLNRNKNQSSWLW